MKKYLFGILLLVAMMCTNRLLAQKAENDGVSNVFKVNFLYPGISYEQKILKFTTINFIGYMNILATTQSGLSNEIQKVYFCPAFNLEIRNYYNYKRRQRKGLRTEMNSMNYAGPIFNGNYIKVSDKAGSRLVNVVGAVWGMQRNYPKRFSLDFNLGLGYLFNAPVFKNNNSLFPLAQLNLGFWLNKKNI